MIPSKEIMISSSPWGSQMKMYFFIFISVSVLPQMQISQIICHTALVLAFLYCETVPSLQKATVESQRRYCLQREITWTETQLRWGRGRRLGQHRVCGNRLHARFKEPTIVCRDTIPWQNTNHTSNNGICFIKLLI